MNESLFRNEAEKVFLNLEDEIDSYDWDFDVENTGDVLTIYNGGDIYMIFTKSYSHGEIWLVAGKDTFHFAYQAKSKEWLSTKNAAEELMAVTRHYLEIVSGIVIN